MVIKTRVEPIADFVGISINEALSPKARSKAVADYARGSLSEAQKTNERVLGRVPPHKTFVDGRPGAALESVNPDRGVIVFEFELLVDVLLWIGRQLQERSPVLSGRYKQSHTLFADGREVALGGNIPAADEYTFTNTVPYARKIEIGKTKSGRNFVINVQPRIYERTAKDARARFGNMVKIAFTYRGIVGGAQINPRRAGGSRTHNRSDLRYPTIIVTTRAS